ncbi:MAG: nucleolar NOP52 variant [Lasallia pustulata]|uniref:Nucleolar NOP52 variant n=1 Tax=Lasallia pustulata TaxID=136370 RepID=A0A5M8PNS7_9LECA|nr:MAG: nucleolar NOP52 variant [Lasallia pustulata]
MASVQETPFVKQLASNDRPTREKALSSLRTYLTSNRTFTPLELLKLWKGLFFCTQSPSPSTTSPPSPPTNPPPPTQAYGTPTAPSPNNTSPQPSPRSSSPPPPLFLPYLHAFWTTISHSWSTIDSLRLDKYLFLVRRYIHASFLYLLNHGWDSELVPGYVELVETIPLSVGAEASKVPDGLRYHVLDCWVDELEKVDGGRGAPGGVDAAGEEGGEGGGDEGGEGEGEGGVGGWEAEGVGGEGGWCGGGERGSSW